MMSQRNEEKYLMTGQAQTSQIEVEDSHAKIEFGSILLNNKIFQGKEKEEDVGLYTEAQINLSGLNGSRLNEFIKRMDSSSSILKARKEQLLKSKANYWVELVEEDEDEINDPGALVPYQCKNIGELEKGLRGVSLKRKAVEGSDSPLTKRRKDHNRDSPKSSRDRGRAQTELQKIEAEEGSDPFGFRYDGKIYFDKGSISKNGRGGCKRIRKALFLDNFPRLHAVRKGKKRKEKWKRTEMAVKTEIWMGTVASLFSH